MAIPFRPAASTPPPLIVTLPPLPLISTRPPSVPVIATPASLPTVTPAPSPPLEEAEGASADSLTVFPLPTFATFVRRPPAPGLQLSLLRLPKTARDSGLPTSRVLSLPLTVTLRQPWSVSWLRLPSTIADPPRQSRVPLAPLPETTTASPAAAASPSGASAANGMDNRRMSPSLDHPKPRSVSRLLEATGRAGRGEGLEGSPAAGTARQRPQGQAALGTAGSTRRQRGLAGGTLPCRFRVELGGSGRELQHRPGHLEVLLRH